MRLVINGRFLTRPMTGVDRMAENIVRHLDQIWPAASAGPFTIAVPRGACRHIPLTNGVIRECGWQKGALWEQVDLPAHHSGALLLSLCNTAPIAHARNIIAVHDANVFDHPASYSRGFRAWYGFLLPRLARRAVSVITVSQHSAQRLAANGVTARPVRVIANGCDHFSVRPAPIEARKPMVLFAGSPAGHKNLALFVELARRFQGRGLEFVVAGAAGSKVYSTQTTDGGASGGNVHFLGRIDDAALVSAYSQASVLLFPSFVEGFGLTPLEAQSFGCPVISSNRAPMTELLGDSALYADPCDADAWAAHLERLLSDNALSQQLSRSGLANAARYRWRVAAREYLEVILEALQPALPPVHVRARTA